jgi:putative membrane protein
MLAASAAFPSGGVMAQVLGRSVFAALALVLSFGAYAADKKSSDGKASKSDASFMKDAANDSAAEIALGKVVPQKSQNADVKAFSQRMVDDHTKASQELEPIASRMGVSLPKEPTGSHAKMVKELAKKDKKFDHEYAEAMVKDHEKAVKLFEKTSKKGDSEEVRQFAAKTLPTLQEHLKMAKDLKAKVK